MSELFKNNRIKFNKQGVQKNFILKAEKILNLTEPELAHTLKVGRRTISDWTKERITISHVATQKISELSGLPIPKNHTVIDWRLHWQNAGRIGAQVKMNRYGSVGGDEEYRKEKWREWWNKIGQYQKNPKGFQSLIKIKIPKKSKRLAEFIGILLGDGHISAYQIGITLSSEEKEYIQYIRILIEKLFGVMPKVLKHKRSKAVTLVVSRKLLVDFCQKVGFKMGNKVSHQVDIPEWIKENRGFARECVRGLIDTDGCFFTHKYIIGKKKYSYFKIAFTSASVPLRLSVEKILINFGFNVRMTKMRINSNGRDIRIDDRKSVSKYIQEIGSHNQKHLDKIEKWKVALNGKAAVC